MHDKVLPTNKENALTICDYISSLKSEINPSDHYRLDKKNEEIKTTMLHMCELKNTVIRI
jgi:hypothetical protein